MELFWAKPILKILSLVSSHFQAHTASWRRAFYPTQHFPRGKPCHTLKTMTYEYPILYKEPQFSGQSGCFVSKRTWVESQLYPYVFFSHRGEVVRMETGSTVCMILRVWQQKMKKYFFYVLPNEYIGPSKLACMKYLAKNVTGNLLGLWDESWLGLALKNGNVYSSANRPDQVKHLDRLLYEQKLKWLYLFLIQQFRC